MRGVLSNSWRQMNAITDPTVQLEVSKYTINSRYGNRTARTLCLTTEKGESHIIWESVRNNALEQGNDLKQYIISNMFICKNA